MGAALMMCKNPYSGEIDLMASCKENQTLQNEAGADSVSSVTGSVGSALHDATGQS
eukprot:CAMPEP_0203882064 /NCGR_PEP_ID=MMETSP0359-20131031/26303_1 /ASSEMBLY_ACC=CAM_ASM_000338 /TAXON_ID=268821 /ORGANISM="Scrippsiella Hangoei, Strain SHTV-5" /LENGTH=55 /DNA_ID=CAMNT_0050802041 /DNA_START=51 /DNA_END=218 /DNA_ORIENTATION=+